MKSNPFLFYTHFLLSFFLNKCFSEELKICLKYQQHQSSAAAFKVTVNLKGVYNSSNQLLSKDDWPSVPSGEQMGIPMSTNDDESGQIILVFHIYVKPIGNEDQTNGIDKNPSVDQPFKDGISTLNRSVSFGLYKPNFEKRYTVNLGQIDPPQLFWKRRILHDVKNSAPGTFHAFLYTISGNGPAMIFLGYAPLIFFGEKSLAPHQGLDSLLGEASTSQQPLFEYHLSIPIINAQQLLKPKIGDFYLRIYQLEEKKKTEGDEETAECLICKQQFLDNQLSIKLPEDDNKDPKHIFHKNCIFKWMVFRMKFFCPFCYKKPKMIMSSSFGPIFNGENDETTLLISPNPIRAIQQFANGGIDGNEFKRNQAKIVVAKLKAFLSEKELLLKILFDKIGLLKLEESNTVNFFSIGPDGYKETPIFEENKEELKKITEEIQENDEMNMKKESAIIALELIKEVQQKLIEYDQILENIQLIDEE